MRVMVKRLLKKYHYPPEGQEQALRTVMEQCNRWADDEDNYYEEFGNGQKKEVHTVRMYSMNEDEDFSSLMAAEDEEK